MIRNSSIIFLFIVLVFSSCVDFFHPNLENESSIKYVVDGLITDQEGYHYVYVSKTSTIEKPNFDPLSYCDVKIIDNDGHIFQFEENYKKGTYQGWISKKYLKPGNSYQVKVTTASGIEIVSEFDQMHECPDVDSIYFIRKDIPTDNPKVAREGIQFYIDVNRQSTSSSYYRWNLTETWEHHAAYSDIMNGSWFKCWTTQEIKDVFTLSTKNYVQSKYHLKPLHFVDNLTQRLTFCYSLYVEQFAVSEAAFNYWDNLRKNSNEQGGLYNTQPTHIKGNLKSSTNPNIEILGFFGASSVRTKRIFVQKVKNLKVYVPVCSPPEEINKFNNNNFNYFITINGLTYGLNDACVECDYENGTTTKPSFWPY